MAKMLIELNANSLYSIEGIKFIPGLNEIEITQGKFDHLCKYKLFKHRLDTGILKIVEKHGLNEGSPKLTKKYIGEINDILKLNELKSQETDSKLLGAIEEQIKKVTPTEEEFRKDAKKK